jgi:IMP dehydrogenase/GMP reductase
VSSAITTVAGASARITMAADGGPYCVKVFDTGTLTAPVSFTVAITHP